MTGSLGVKSGGSGSTMPGMGSSGDSVGARSRRGGSPGGGSFRCRTGGV